MEVQCIFGYIKNGEKTLQQVEEDLNQLTSGNPKCKSEKQSYTIKIQKIFVTRGKNILIYLMIKQKLDLKPFTNQNKIKHKEHVLRY